MTKLRLWPCKDIDFSWSDVGFALRNCVIASKTQADRKGLLDPVHQSLVCMSVRAAFDLYLASRGWGRGDECLFVGVNVPDMFRVAESRGICAVGADIDPLTTEVDLLQLRERISQNTRCIVIPHLFGYRYCIDGVIELANNHGIDVVEDCAQAFAGTDWSGSEGATLSLFSFGPMKTATALQGAVAIVRDSTLFEMMSRRLNSYPVQTTWRYLSRILRFSLMKTATHRLIYGLLVRLLRLFRVDHEAVIHALSKSGAGASFERWLRLKPSIALTRVIQRKIANSDDHIHRRTAKGAHLTDAIGNVVPLVARQQEHDTYWMIPVLVDDSDSLKDELRRIGFDAVSGRLRATDRVEALGSVSIENSVMLPFLPCMPDAELTRLGVSVTDYFEARS